MLNLNNTLDGYLKNVEVIGNTIQDTNNLANIRSVGDKVEGQELYKIELACYGDNILRPDFEVGIWNVSNGTAQADSTAIRTKGFLRIRNQAHLVKRFDGKLGCQVILFDENFKYLGQQSYAGGNYVRYDNILPNAKYMKINFLNTTDLNLQCVLFDRVPSNINGVEFVEFQESELEILSPVQLEKVGDVADRIICKDGVWGVEKNCVWFNDYIQDVRYANHVNDFLRIGIPRPSYFEKPTTTNMDDFRYICNLVPFADWRKVDTSSKEGMYVAYGADVMVLVIKYDRIGTTDKNTVIQYLNDNFECLFKAKEPQFIPLPQDQQVKLRTFAGQTNIAFLTEIPGQIKAQVPKSLGATVNAHTEQIADLHNSLERVKKLEETTVSTVETKSNFTTVEATSNGYFEDVKLEGKTLVNHLCNSENTVSSTNATSKSYVGLQAGKTYTAVVNVIENNNNKTFYPFRITYSDNSQINIPSSAYPKGSVITYKFELADKGINFLWVNWCANYVAGDIITTKTLLLEGDHTQNPPEYFEGLMSVGQDVEEVSVESGFNLFTPENYLINTVGTGLVGDIPTYNQDANYYCLNIPVEYNEVYVRTSGSWVRFIDKSGTVIFSDNVVGKYIVVPKDVDRMLLNVVKGDVPTFKLCKVSNKKPLLYYNPTTETWEKPVLREWDTIEKHSDGKYYYHKRSGEVVLNGSEDWVSDKSFDTTRGFYLQNFGIATNYVICKDFKYNTQSDFGSKDEECVSCNNNAIKVRVLSSKLPTQDVAGFKAWLQANNVTVVYQLAQEEVYECTNIDLMTYSGETNYIINSGAISPKSILKVHNNISNVVKILQEKVSLLENTFIAGLKSVLSGDMYSLATILYPEDFEQNDNTEQDIMVIPE